MKYSIEIKVILGFRRNENELFALVGCNAASIGND